MTLQHIRNVNIPKGMMTKTDKTIAQLVTPMVVTILRARGIRRKTKTDSHPTKI